MAIVFLPSDLYGVRAYAEQEIKIKQNTKVKFGTHVTSAYENESLGPRVTGVLVRATLEPR